MNAAGSEVGLSVPGLSNRSLHLPASNGVRGRTDFSLTNSRHNKTPCCYTAFFIVSQCLLRDSLIAFSFALELKKMMR